MSKLRVDDEEPVEETEGTEETQAPSGSVQVGGEDLMGLLAAYEHEEPAKMRLLSLYGEISEEVASEAIFTMRALHSLGRKERLEKATEEGEEDRTIVEHEPFEFAISTWGGSAHDMFAIYDTMRMIREDCEIETIGLGKVMSAGVLLLAAGTKGKRRIGANTRIMLHSVIAGSHGALHNLENDLKEARWIQDQHIGALADETTMTKRQLARLMNRKVNVYLTAEQAVEKGIADIII